MQRLCDGIGQVVWLVRVSHLLSTDSLSARWCGTPFPDENLDSLRVLYFGQGYAAK